MASPKVTRCLDCGLVVGEYGTFTELDSCLYIE